MRPGSLARLPRSFELAVQRSGARASRFLLAVSVATQTMRMFEHRHWDGRPRGCRALAYLFRREFVVSTSRFGVGQQMHSNCTPLGLHRVARKVGAGYPIGTVFEARLPAGLTWAGRTEGSIVHRILWLEGLQPGFNRGGDVDTFRRHVYIHGYADETTLGRPRSRGCVHLSAADLMPLFDRLPVGTLVWIDRR